MSNEENSGMKKPNTPRPPAPKPGIVYRAPLIASSGLVIAMAAATALVIVMLGRGLP